MTDEETTMTTIERMARAAEAVASYDFGSGEGYSDCVDNWPEIVKAALSALLPLDEGALKAAALSAWKEREKEFPAFTRRPAPDDIDQISGSYMAVEIQARAAITAYLNHIREGT